MKIDGKYDDRKQHLIETLEKHKKKKQEKQ